LLSTQPPKAPHFPSLPCLIIAPTLKPRKKNPTHTGRKHDLRARGTDLGLDVVDGVRGLDLEGDGLTREAVVSIAQITPVSVFLCHALGVEHGKKGNGNARLDEDLHLIAANDDRSV
jgi:hypothetical protein